MEKDEFIEELGIDGEQSYDENGTLTITLPDAEAWSNAQVILEDTEQKFGLEEDQESSKIDRAGSDIQYLNDYFIINLIASFKDPEDPDSEEEYKLTIKDR